MKSKLNLMVTLFIMLPIISYGQSNGAVKNFRVTELLSMLDSLPADKINGRMQQHGFTFEKKANVYSPYVNGAVKNAYSLRYLRDKEVFIISFYEEKKYLISYFAGSAKDFDNLVNEIVPAGFVLANQKGNLKFYDLNNKYEITAARLTDYKVISIADRPFAEKYKLSIK